MVGVRTVAAIAAVIAALGTTPAALGATAREIGADLADGRLDGKYTKAELNAFLKNATQQGYPSAGEQAVAGLPAGGGEDVQVVHAAAGTLPFTGVDLALLVVGGTMILLVGFGLRRVARATP